MYLILRDEEGDPGKVGVELSRDEILGIQLSICEGRFILFTLTDLTKDDLKALAHYFLSFEE